MLGLYNYIEPFFSEYGISATQGARPQSACDGPGGSEPCGVGVRLSSVSCVQIGMGTANVHGFIYLSM